MEHPDFEYVFEIEHNNIYLNPGLGDKIKDYSGFSHAIGSLYPDLRSDVLMAVTYPDIAILSWPHFLKNGVRTGSPTGTSQEWNKEFFATADSLSYRVDFTGLYHCISEPDVASSIDKAVEISNGRPVWISSLGFEAFSNGFEDSVAEARGPERDADFNIKYYIVVKDQYGIERREPCEQDDDGAEPFIISWPHSPDNSAQYINWMKNAIEQINKHPKVERFCISGRVFDGTKMYINEKITPAGKYFQKIDAELAYDPDQEYEHLWHIAPPFITTALSNDRKTFNLSWYDHNGETGKCYVIFCRDIDTEGNAGEWKEVGRKTLGIDYQPGETVVFSYPADMNEKREFRISAISYKDEMSIFSRNHSVVRDHVKGELYLEITSVSHEQASLKWSSVEGIQNYRIERKESGSDNWEIVNPSTTWNSDEDSVRAGKVYSFRVATQSNAENEIFSNEVTVEIPGNPYQHGKPKKISGLFVSEGDGQITLTWDKTRPVGMDIERINYYGMRVTVAKNNTSGQFTDKDLINGRPYTYILKPSSIYYNPDPEEDAEDLTVEITATPQEDQYIHIPFNDGPGLTAKDMFGGGHAKIRGGFKWQKTEDGYYDAVTLNPNCKAYIEVPGALFQNLEDRTYIIDVTIPEGTSGPIFQHSYYSDKYVTLGFDPTVEHALYVEIKDKAINRYNFNCPANTDQLRIALVTDSEDMYLYVNGEKAGDVKEIVYPDFKDENYSVFNLGTEHKYKDGTYTNIFSYSPFTFSDLRVFARALTQAEISNLSGTDSIEEIISDTVGSAIVVQGGKGMITVTSTGETIVNIYSADGRLINGAPVTLGKTKFYGILPGIYIVAGHKILVK